MPDEIKPDASLDEEQTPDIDSGEEAQVAEEAPANAGENAAEETPKSDGTVVGVADEEAAQPEEPDLSEIDDIPEGSTADDALSVLEKEDSETPGKDDDFPDLSGVQVEEPTAAPAEFQQLGGTEKADSKQNIDILLDVKMPVSIELGRTEMPISELLVLGPGSVVELTRLAGEPVDLLVNGKVIARGEVVVVDENFGVRVTLLLSPEERLKALAQE